MVLMAISEMEKKFSQAHFLSEKNLTKKLSNWAGACLEYTNREGEL